MRASNLWLRSLASLSVVAALSGCGGSTSTPVVTTTTSNVNAFARLDPTAGSLDALPLPSDALLRSAQTGFNALPGSTEPIVSFNTLQGFSTSAPIYIPFEGNLDSASLSSSTVCVVDTTSNTAVEVTLGITTGQTGQTIVATPVRPLVSGRSYLVYVTTSVRSAGGSAVQSATIPSLLKQTAALVDGSNHSTAIGLSDTQAQQLEPLRQAWQPIWAGAEAHSGVTRDKLAMAFRFTTQSLFTTLRALNTDVNNQAAPTPTVGSILGLPSGSFFGSASVDAFFTGIGQSAIPHADIGGLYTGTFSSPNYISYTDPSNPAGAPWQIGGGGLPTVQTTRTQQFIACLPNPTNYPVSPGGYPTVIYVHGITRNMLDVLALANTLNSQGIAVIAINQPLHGSNCLISLNAYQNTEQGDGFGFLNLNNLRTGRDNLRQSVADLFQLTRAITAGNTGFDATNYPNQPLLASTPPAVIAQSLGSIVSTAYLATEQNAQAAVLNVAGGRISSLLQGSTFGTQVNAGLAQLGILPGTSSYRDFFWISQTMLDDGDSFNYGPHVATDEIRGGSTAPGLPHYTLLQEMIGDTTVPNSATTDLARAMNLPQAYAKSPISGLTQASGATVQGSMLYQFNGGAHGFLIDGTAQTVPCQQQVVSYLGGYFLSNPGGPTITNIQPFAGPRRTAGPAWIDARIRTTGVFVMPDFF